jgi:hypothetical protein
MRYRYSHSTHLAFSYITLHIKCTDAYTLRTHLALTIAYHYVMDIMHTNMKALALPIKARTPTLYL